VTEASASRSGTAVVTGGASGFGRAIGEQCAARGFDVALLDIDGERATKEAAGLGDRYGARVVGLRTDVGEEEEVAAAAAHVADEFGGADLVFSNVGVQQIGTLESFTDEAWSWMLNINVVGAARVARAFLPLLRRSDSPRLAFTASASVLAPASHLAAYQASKFAVLGLAEGLRLEVADDGILVSVIFPSGMITRHLESSLAARPEAVTQPIADPGDTKAMLASNPTLVRDVTTPEIAARCVLDDVLAGARYVVTHGNLVEQMTERHARLFEAVEAARRRTIQNGVDGDGGNN